MSLKTITDLIKASVTSYYESMQLNSYALWTDTLTTDLDKI